MRQFTLGELAPWIAWRFDPARGPGGQNVNKVSTRATLLFDLDACGRLDDAQRARIRSKLGGRVSRSGQLRVVAARERTQAANRALAERRLIELITRALHTQAERRATRPTAGAHRRRVEAKRRRGEVKRCRRAVIDE